MKPKPQDITFHYTNEQMVKDLMTLIPFQVSDSVLDAGSGKNKVWYKNIPNYCIADECEIEDGKDFLLYGTILDKENKRYDWIIGNPPFHQGWLFLEKASQISNKGIAFLGNLNFWNSCLPNRFKLLEKRGFYLNKIHIVQDKRWFGRYYFLIFTKQKNKFLSWECKSY
jgi:hypothetical protein